ncbi:MAG: serine/threonine protein kinase [Chloroflexi bacterium]|nr:serine/threonine protein kinase [Chloroflexota bacterium]
MAGPSAIGRYQIFAELGAGGFATVYRAYDPVLDRELAIKVLHPHMARDPSVRERFVREGRALARLRHPNIVLVHDAGETDGYAYLAMEFVPGRSLADVLSSRPLSAAEMLPIVRGVAQALDTIHAAGLVHRDVKPANILIAEDGRTVLLDLGIARAVDRPGVTSNSLVVGTPEFLAPEQLDDDGVIGRFTDIYQLGATVYAMLAGRAPYQGRTTELLYAIVHHPPPDLGALRPDLPPHIPAAVSVAMARHPRDRQRYATDFADALEGPATPAAPAAALTSATLELPADALPFGPITPPTGTPAPGMDTAATRQQQRGGPPPAPVPAGPGTPESGDVRPPRRRARWPLVAGAGVVAALAAGGAVFALGRGGDDPPPPSPTARVMVSPATSVTATRQPSATAGPRTATPTPTRNPSATPTATPTRTAAPGSVPTSALAGKKVATCWFLYKFDLAVERAEWSRRVGGKDAAANMMWAVLVVNATNTTITIGVPALVAQLRDDRGRDAEPSTDPLFVLDVAKEFGAEQPFDVVQRGASRRIVLVFSAPADAKTLTLVSSNVACRA